jgi:lipoprotein signal peptidase
MEAFSQRFLPKYFFLIVIVAIIDVLSKVLVYSMIPLYATVPVISDFFYIYPILNETGLNPLAFSITEGNQLFSILISLSGVILGVYIIFIRKTGLKKWLQVLIGIAVHIGLSLLSGAVAESFPVYGLNTHLVAVLTMIGPLFIAILFFCISKRSYFKLVWAFVTAGGLGNFLSYFYPPFRVVDFLVLRPFGSLVFNIADISAAIGFFILIISPVVFLIKFVAGKTR